MRGPGPMAEAGLERALDELSDGGGPRDGWQDCVLARIDVRPAPASRLPRWPLVAAGSGLIAAAAAVILFVALRSPERAPAPPVDNRAALEQLVREIDQLSLRREEAAVELLRAKTEMERFEADQAFQEAKRQMDAVEKSLHSLKAKARKTGTSKQDKVVAKCEPNDPLCGIN